MRASLAWLLLLSPPVAGAAGRLGYGNTSTIGDDEAPASAGDAPISQVDGRREATGARRGG